MLKIAKKSRSMHIFVGQQSWSPATKREGKGRELTVSCSWNDHMKQKWFINKDYKTRPWFENASMVLIKIEIKTPYKPPSPSWLYVSTHKPREGFLDPAKPFLYRRLHSSFRGIKLISCNTFFPLCLWRIPPTWRFPFNIMMLPG